MPLISETPIWSLGFRVGVLGFEVSEIKASGRAVKYSCTVGCLLLTAMYLHPEPYDRNYG